MPRLKTREDFELEDDLRTLIRAENITKDTKRMAKVRTFASKKQKEIELATRPNLQRRK